MKTNLLRATVALLAAAAVCESALAEESVQQKTSAEPVRTFTGTVSSINVRDHLFTVSKFLFKKRFVARDDCTVSLADKPEAQLADLRPGCQVTVTYRAASDVAMAKAIRQQAMTVKGSIDALDTNDRTLAVRQGWLLRKFTLPADCKILLRDNRQGTLDALKVGHPVTVAYTKTDGKLSAYEIDQTNREFTGDINAIDLSAGVVKARHLMSDKQFSLATDCNIIVNGKRNARLSDLKLGETAQFSFEERHGVCIVHRIAQGETPTVATARHEREDAVQDLRHSVKTSSLNP